MLKIKDATRWALIQRKNRGEIIAEKLGSDLGPITPENHAKRCTTAQSRPKRDNNIAF